MTSLRALLVLVAFTASCADASTLCGEHPGNPENCSCHNVRCPRIGNCSHGYLAPRAQGPCHCCPKCLTKTGCDPSPLDKIAVRCRSIEECAGVIIERGISGYCDSCCPKCVRYDSAEFRYLY